MRNQIQSLNQFYHLSKMYNKKERQSLRQTIKISLLKSQFKDLKRMSRLNLKQSRFNKRTQL